MFSGYHRTREKRQPEPFWKVIRNSILEIRNPDFLTAEQIRSTDLLKVSQAKFLDKGARGIMKFLSELPGKTAETVVKNPNVPD